MTRDFEHCLTPSDFTLLLNAIPVLSKRGAFHLKEYDQIAPLHARMMEVARRHRKLFQFAPNDEEDDTVQNGRVSVAHASDTDDDEDDEGNSSSDSSVDSDIEVRWEADKTVREEAMEPPPQPAPTSSKHHAHSHTRSSERSEEKNKHGRDRERRTKRD
jgi:hypothetical protein